MIKIGMPVTIPFDRHSRENSVNIALSAAGMAAAAQ